MQQFLLEEPCRWLQQPFTRRMMAVNIRTAAMAMQMIITSTHLAGLMDPTMVALMGATLGDLR